MAPSAVARDTSDATLVRLWTAGDPHAFDELVERHAPLIYGRCRRALGDVDADDATQAVFLVMARRREQAAATPVLAAWLMQVAANVVRNALRDRQRRRNAELSAPPLQPAVEEPPMTGFQEHLDACLGELPAAERDAITLHHLAGLTLAEVAVRTEAGVSTVKDRLNRGLERMRKAFIARGITLSVPVLLSLLAVEAQAAAPAETLAHVRSTATPRAQRWAKQPKPLMTRIAIAASALLLIGGSVTAIVLTSTPAKQPSAPTVQVLALHPAAGPTPAPYLDPEHARAYTLLRWNDGARTAQRLRSIPEIALLPPDALAMLEQVASLRQGVVVASMSTMMSVEERVHEFRLQRDLAQLPPAGRVERMRQEYQRLIKLVKEAEPQGTGPVAVSVEVTARSDETPVQTIAATLLPWPCLHGWLEFTGAETSAMQTIRARLGGSAPLLGATPRVTPQGWSLDMPKGACRISIAGSRLIIDGVDEPGLAPIMALATKPGDGADLACSFLLDPGLPDMTLRRTGYMHLTVDKDGLEVDSLLDWPTLEQAAEAASAPRLDLGRMSSVPADAFLIAAIPLSPAATRDSVVWQTVFLLLERLSAVSRHEQPLIRTTITNMCQGIRDLLSHTEGTVVLWAQPGMPVPTLTLEIDASQEAAAALIASTGLPRNADGSVNQVLGMVNLAMAWRDGRLICTTVPGGIDAINRSGGLLEQPDVRRAVAAMPTRTPQLCVLLRPAAFADTVGPYVSMLSPEWMKRMQAYEQRLSTDQAYGFLTAHMDQRGTHINATGALSVLAAGILAAQASGQMNLPRVAN